jgi:hypothetical protein
MADAKPFASLSSGLLARKGGAKPAMRPQGYASFGSTHEFGSNLEDLGWDDMGDMPDHVPTPIDALTPSRGASVRAVVTEPEEVAEPVVVEQQRALQESFAEPEEDEAEAEPEALALVPEPEPEPQPEPAPEPVARRRIAPKPAEVVTLPQSRELPAKAKSAFTLRLDPERHLKLRLACALGGRSAQHLVTAALDEYLNSLPEIGALAGHRPAAGKSGR